jgi:hypothetical protein
MKLLNSLRALEKDNPEALLDFAKSGDLSVEDFTPDGESYNPDEPGPTDEEQGVDDMAPGEEEEVH